MEGTLEGGSGVGGEVGAGQAIRKKKKKLDGTLERERSVRTWRGFGWGNFRWMGSGGETGVFVPIYTPSNLLSAVDRGVLPQLAIVEMLLGRLGIDIGAGKSGNEKDIISVRCLNSSNSGFGWHEDHPEPRERSVNRDLRRISQETPACSLVVGITI